MEVYPSYWTCCACTYTTTGPVRGIDFHSNQPLFVSGGDDYKIKVNSGFKLVYTLQYTYSVAQVQKCCRKSGDPLMFCLLTPLMKLLPSMPDPNIHVLVVGMEIWDVLPLCLCHWTLCCAPIIPGVELQAEEVYLHLARPPGLHPNHILPQGT